MAKRPARSAQERRLRAMFARLAQEQGTRTPSSRREEQEPSTPFSEIPPAKRKRIHGLLTELGLVDVPAKGVSPPAQEQQQAMWETIRDLAKQRGGGASTLRGVRSKRKIKNLLRPQPTTHELLIGRKRLYREGR